MTTKNDDDNDESTHLVATRKTRSFTRALAEKYMLTSPTIHSGSTTSSSKSSSRRTKNGKRLKASADGRAAPDPGKGNEADVKQDDDDDDRKDEDDGLNRGLSSMTSDVLMDPAPDIRTTSSSNTTKRKKGGGGDDVDDYISSARTTKTKMRKSRKRVKKENDDDDDDDQEHVDDIEDFSSLPPPHWREVYEAMKSQRAKMIAPVDTMGCERLAQEDVSPKVYIYLYMALHPLASPFPTSNPFKK